MRRGTPGGRGIQAPEMSGIESILESVQILGIGAGLGYDCGGTSESSLGMQQKKAGPRMTLPMDAFIR
jgi:hypothetical protein